MAQQPTKFNTLDDSVVELDNSLATQKAAPTAPQGYGGPQLMDKNYLESSQPYMNQMRSQVQGGPQNNPWMRYQMQQEGIRQAGDRDRLARGGAANIESQQGQMAMRGGLNVGSVERLGRQNLMGQLQGQQALSRGAGAREAGIRSQSAARQDALSGRLGRAEMDRATFKKDVDSWNAGQINKDNAAWHAAQAGNGPVDVNQDPTFKEKYWDYDVNETRGGNFSMGGAHGLGMSFKGESGPDDDAYLSVGGQKIF